MREGWEIKKLGEVCNFQNGFAFKSKTYKDEGTPVVRITNIQDEKLDLTKIVYIDPKDYNKDLSKYKIVKGDLLIAMSGATTGKIGIHKTDEELLLNQRVGKFEPKQTLDKTYLLNFLKTKVEESLAISAGAAQPNLSTEQIKGFEIPLPSPPEQQRIVQILDKAFVAIDKAKQNAEQNLRNAKEVFHSKLQSIFDNGKLKVENGEWVSTSLKDEIDLGTGFAFKSKYYTNNDDDILLLRGDNIMQGNFRWKDAKRWNKSEYDDFEKYQLQENDIVLAMDRPWVNAGLKCARLSNNELPSLLVQRTARLRNKPQLNNLFLYYLIQSKGFTDYLISIQTGIGVPHISGKQICGFPFSKPPLKEQQQIVKKLNPLSAETKKLESIYQQKLESLAELKKSILQKAFRGEL